MNYDAYKLANPYDEEDKHRAFLDEVFPEEEDTEDEDDTEQEDKLLN